MNKIKILIPKGRIFERVKKLMLEAGYEIKDEGRNYKPKCNVDFIEFKIMKPQNIPQLIELGRQDIGFTGLDWIKETNSEVKVLMDLGYDKVNIVAAAPSEEINIWNKENLLVATEYPNIAKRYLDSKKINYTIIKSYGTTEVFVPEDADMIIDNTSTGQTLKENNLEIIDVVDKSSTVMIANKNSLKDEWKKEKIDEILMMINSVILAKEKILVEMNVSSEKFEGLIKVLPCMKSPTISKLNDGGFAIKSAIPKKDLTKIIPLLKKAGATDILEYDIARIVE